MDRKFLAVSLAACLLLAQGAQAAHIGKPTSLPELSKVWGDLGQSATVNEYVDDTLHLLLPHLAENGFDPMSLPEIVEGFSVRPVLITYSAWLKIHDGYMTGLMNIERSGDQRVNYFAKMLRVKVVLQFQDLNFVYRYLVQVMNLGPTGGIVGTLARLVVTTDLLIDFNNDEVHLQEFSFSEIGRLRVRLTGNILTDWLVNPVIGVFVGIFDNIIIKVVESNIRKGVQDGIDIINAGINDALSKIEAI